MQLGVEQFGLVYNSSVCCRTVQLRFQHYSLLPFHAVDTMKYACMRLPSHQHNIQMMINNILTKPNIKMGIDDLTQLGKKSMDDDIDIR